MGEGPFSNMQVHAPYLESSGVVFGISRRVGYLYEVESNSEIHRAHDILDFDRDISRLLCHQIKTELRKIRPPAMMAGVQASRASQECQQPTGQQRSSSSG